ncbi:MAG: sensor histidine kinase, partial [Owenweeksia sp.]
NLRSHSGNIEMMLTLLNNNPEPDEQEELIQNLNHISSNLSEAIVHLNEVVSIQTDINQQREPLNLYEYVQNTLKILAGEIQSVEASVDNGVPKDTIVNYNPAYLESILLNFISNAIKYRHPDRKPEIQIRSIPKNGSQTIVVSDNGLGIDLKKHKAKLFGMYKTFHRNKDSRGIGLFITKNQVESMGGKIEVKSEVNKGTTFSIALG